MFQRIKEDPLYRFLLLSGILFLIWFVSYEFILKPNGTLDRFLIDNLIDLSGGVLVLLGFALIPEPINAEEIRTIGVDGGSLLWIGDPCNGLSLFVVFIIFMVTYPGPWKHKAWFIPLGLISIHLINTIRIIVLCLIVTIDYELLTFNHDYTFYVIVYGWVFLLWWYWTKMFAPKVWKVNTDR